MTEMTDADVFGAPKEMTDADVFGKPAAPTYGNVSESIPEAFLDRVRAGQAIGRIVSAAGKEASNVPPGTPTGFEDETLSHLTDLGIFHDPAKSRGGPIQIANEAVMFPLAQAWQSIVRGTAMGIHGAGGAFGQVLDELGVSNEAGLFFGGGGEKAKNEVINFGNWAMIEGGMGRFSRPQVDPQMGVTERVVGGLPVEADFVNAGKVLDPRHSEREAFSKSEVSAPREAEPRGTEPSQLPEQLRSGPTSIKTTPISGKPLYHETSPESAAAMLADDLTNSVDRIRASNIFVADNPDIAIGQGGKGVRIEFDGDLVSGAEHVKPGTGDLTGREYRTNAIGNNAIRSITVSPGESFPLKPSWRARLDATFEKSTLPDGSTLYERNDVQHIAETNLRRMWKEDGITPAEAVHDAQSDAFLRHDITAPREEIKPDPETEAILTETGGAPGSLSAAVTPPEEIPLDVQPASPPGRLIASAQASADKLFDVGRDIQMKLAPMARGSKESMAIVKDYRYAMERNAWDASRYDDFAMKKFTPEQHARMANAMEEESLSLRLGEPASAREHQGLSTLSPEERAFVVEQDTRQQLAWLRARDLGMVEGEGVEMHFPRMVVGIPKGLDKGGEGAISLTAMGLDVRSQTPYLKQRKHLELEQTERAVKQKIGAQLAEQGKSADEIAAALEKVKVVRDIRAVNLATKQLEDAVAGRQLVENIKEVGKRTGNDALAEGVKPNDTWFTVDHPAFKTWRPKFEEVDGKIEAVKGADGNPVFEQVPLYVRGDFEGPLRAVMWGKSGEAYQGLMAIKGKTMSYVMNSPMIHNLVEWGRALAAAPLQVGTLRIYFTGNRAKYDPAVMHEAIGHGLVPIGKRFFNQDINALMETPSLTPGRSIEAQALAMVPGLFDEAAGVAVKRAVDKAGDFWHNTMLWDRIADLQAGLYVHLRDSKIAAGVDRDTASYLAARWANQYAGALPKEAMSEAATKVSNFMLFSRSFTFGNLSVIKDAFTGLPRDVLAQIERDARFKAGSIEAADEAGAQAVSSATSMGRRKALMTLGLEMALLYAGNSVLQSAFNVMLGGKTLDQEGHDYIRRFRDTLNEAQAHPLSLLQPFRIAEGLSSTNENEPNRKERVYVGNAADGTAIYMRAPWGKIGEEFTNWFSSPIDMAKKKEGTIMRPMMQILSNDAGFKREIYDPRAETWPDYVKSAAAIAKHLVLSQLPVGQFSAGMDLVRGEGDKLVNTLQMAGPFAGFTFSKGAPGGQAVGEMYDAKGQHQFAIDQALPDIRKQILRGDMTGAEQRMDQLDIPPPLQRYYKKTTLDPSLRLSPRATRDFYRYANPEQRDRFERAQQAAPQP